MVRITNSTPQFTQYEILENSQKQITELAQHFFLLSSPTNHLMTAQIYQLTLWSDWEQLDLTS